MHADDGDMTARFDDVLAHIPCGGDTDGFNGAVHASTTIRKRPGRQELLRVALCYHESDDLPVAMPAGSQSSAQLRSLTEADGIAVLPEEQGPVAEGDRLDVVPLRGLL